MPGAWVSAAVAVYGAYQGRKTAKENKKRLEEEQRQQALREAEAKAKLAPYEQAAGEARKQLMIELGLAEGTPSTAYQETAGYKSAMEQSMGAVEQQQANLGQAYSGRRMQAVGEAAQGVQNQYYSNYMNMLQGMASPQAAQNMANLGLSYGAMSMQGTQGINQAATTKTATENAALADIMKGWSNYQSQQTTTTDTGSTSTQGSGSRGEWV